MAVTCRAQYNISDSGIHYTNLVEPECQFLNSGLRLFVGGERGKGGVCALWRGVGPVLE